jgi:hypothetical protein
MRVTVSGIEKVMADILKKQEEAVSISKNAVSNKLVSALRDRTPVDTGEARDGWRIDAAGNIMNAVEHIAALNNGHSKQAPAHFVESTVMSFEAVKPNGIIVSNK